MASQFPSNEAEVPAMLSNSGASTMPAPVENNDLSDPLSFCTLRKIMEDVPENRGIRRRIILMKRGFPVTYEPPPPPPSPATIEVYTQLTSLAQLLISQWEQNRDKWNEYARTADVMRSTDSDEESEKDPYIWLIGEWTWNERCAHYGENYPERIKACLVIEQMLSALMYENPSMRSKNADLKALIERLSSVRINMKGSDQLSYLQNRGWDTFSIDRS